MENSKIKTKVLRPKLNNNLDQIELYRENITDEADFSFAIVSDCSLEKLDANKIAFKQVIFKNVIFNEIVFRCIDLVDIRFENCDLSNVDFSEGSLHRVEFINCKIIGINLSEATLRDVVFENCNGQYSFFTYSNCKQVPHSFNVNYVHRVFKIQFFQKLSFKNPIYFRLK